MKKARILEPTPENIETAAKSLIAGQVVGMPTETVYGLAGIAFDVDAVTRIFETKERPTFDPLIVHVAPLAAGKVDGAKALWELGGSGLVDLTRLDDLSRLRVEKLIASFWPGPLTLVLPRGLKVPDLVTSGLATVAIRMPKHPIAQAMIRAAGAPLAAPSANRFGRISPTRAMDVLEELGDRIEWIIDGGPCEIGVESTVLAVNAGGSMILLRPGGISRESLSAALSLRIEEIVLPKAGAGSTAGAQSAPGMLASHYAPSKKLILLDATIGASGAGDSTGIEALRALPDLSLGLLAYSGDPRAKAQELSRLTGKSVLAEILSPNADPAQAARNLFAKLRALDHSTASVLVAEPCPETTGLGHAIMDRLRRAGA